MRALWPMGWLSGRYRKCRDAPEASRAQRFPGRFDLALDVNQRKLDDADALGALASEAGLTLIDMAIVFVIRHPAVTSAIIGPRTLESTWTPSCPPPTSSCRRTCWTGSTRWCLPPSRSTRTTSSRSSPRWAAARRR